VVSTVEIGEDFKEEGAIKGLPRLPFAGFVDHREEVIL
jgi:hypothetical protein